LLLFLAGSVAFAGWEAVQRVSSDHKIEVATQVGKRTRWTFVSAPETALVVRSKSGEYSIARGDLHRVRIADPSRRERNGLIANSIGAGAGQGAGEGALPRMAEATKAPLKACRRPVWTTRRCSG
jgi:hypothetical protein